jgi:hypothetical protein
MVLAAALFLIGSLCAPLSAAIRRPQAADDDVANPRAGEPIEWFDGESLEGWKPSGFAGERAATIVDGCIQLDAGDPLTGVTIDREVPHGNFELRLEARKLKGNDFFCAVTFPVSQSHCTLVLGGWGGTVVGLSSLDGRDASENETTQYRKFEHGQWYAVRIRVTGQRIRCWLDDERIIDVDTEGKTLSLRNEVLLSRPVGICSFATQAQIRAIEWIPLEDSDAEGGSPGR